MKKEIVQIISEYTDVAKRNIKEEAFLVSDLGLTSLDVVNLIVSFEEHYGISISISDISELRQVKDIEHVLVKKIKEKEGK